MGNVGNPNIEQQGKNTRFSSNNQPANRGRKGKAVSEWLAEYGDAKSISFKITITKRDGTKKIKAGRVASRTSINQLLAVTIINKAIKGDNRAITTYLDRTEGKPQQSLQLDHTNNGGDFSHYSDEDLLDEIKKLLHEAQL